MDVNESELIHMKGAILGFESYSRFVLLIHDRNHTPLWWLQSADDANLAFVVVNPLVIKPDYNPIFSEADLEFLKIEKTEDIAFMAIVTVRADPLRVTANLRAPILVNAANRTASQVILNDPSHPIQYDVLAGGSGHGKEWLDEGGAGLGPGRLARVIAAA
jgi:flagellar assembly factor FliW